MFRKETYNIPNKIIKEMSLLEYMDRWRKHDNAGTKKLAERIDKVLTKECKKMLSKMAFNKDDTKNAM